MSRRPLTPRRNPRPNIGLDLIGRGASGIGTHRSIDQGRPIEPKEITQK